MAESKAIAGGGHAVSMNREERKPKKKKLHRVSIERAKNGGHTVEHSFRNGGGMGEYDAPTMHVFSKKDGPALLQHLKRHLGIQDAAGVASEASDDE